MTEDGIRKIPLLIEELEIRIKTYNALINDGIVTVRELCQKSESELLRLPNIGRISVREIKEALATKGFYLGQYLPDGRERQLGCDSWDEPHT